MNPVGRSSRKYCSPFGVEVVATEVFKIEVEIRGEHPDEIDSRSWRVETARYKDGVLVWCGDWI